MFTSLDLANHFGFKAICGDMTALKREIKVLELDRPGVELLGLFSFHQKDRIMLIGNKEMALINDSDPEFIYKNCLKIANPECPAIIITHNTPAPEPLLRACKETNCPLFSSNADTSDLESSMYIYLSEALAKKTSLHACLLEIYGTGVLLLGESGIGKSEISLELIKKGHRLIADDRVNVASVRGKLIGTCPESIRGMMEVRGIGIIDVARMFGINALADRTHIKLVISLVPFNKDEPMERVGMKTDRYEILDETIPLIQLPVRAARSMAEIIEAAVTNYKLKDYGYDTGYEFQRRLTEIQERRMMERREEEMLVNNGKHIVSMNPEPDVPLQPDDNSHVLTKPLVSTVKVVEKAPQEEGSSVVRPVDPKEKAVTKK
ncbi:MAG: HPr(Ser) kinase/phosphatase [Bacilli bacterium]|jgi:HPr kinase/phosphorylase|nr:HPr(Ser) kinase/phosphatase [Bacilli bacterium]